ncbi:MULTISPECIES: DUF3545 family protein [unclassified Idiomarina]|jgi:uncharacterized protein with WD repeat|uniref:DUF3545 family protein n=1 Tax=unclassified Idiomarina TaxID=2614829 RepID=UPI0009F528BE|nr:MULTISPECIES: DUF3545 family protein [unclassified Idiomarina]MAD52522.1 DUF3545 domain-containing protein [Idiomarinaceae bacterium]MEC7642692.1 DUF3545 family protein [Pseudomonadota bacterium]MEC9320286.1 DUF3545 family protein [Pseudomonadota bacterium]NQZ03406.1 DUF3545 family protein [Idiomarina sp.]|tara:strand:- start:312 stop:485 length:174 start_codon:yes stop_codon:yes gene_type:complete
MDHSEELQKVSEKSSKGRTTKRKWREIEQLKEKYRLREELTDIDSSFDIDLEEIELR